MSWLPKNWKTIVAWLVLTLAVSLAGYLGFWPNDQKPDLPDFPLPVWSPNQGTPPPENGNFGWVRDDEQVKAIADTLPFRVFGDTPAGQADDPLPPHVYMWQAYSKHFARPPPSRNQGGVGSCVSFGTNTAIERTMMVDIVYKGANYEYKDIAHEVTYAGSRVEIGGGRISGDGSIGAWAAEFVQKYGVVSREVHGKHDLTTYSETRCRAWGRSGVPDDLEPLAKQHPVKEITLVKTWADAKKALANGYGIAICSGYGFQGNRDANGVKTRRGTWQHCMALDGYHTEGGKEYGHIENSWGERPNEGPVGWGDPPTSGFWVDSKTIQGMLNAGDSWAFSTVVGFPSRQIDWFVHHNPRVVPDGVLGRFNLFALLAREKENSHALRN